MEPTTKIELKIGNTYKDNGMNIDISLSSSLSGEEYAAILQAVDTIRSIVIKKLSVELEEE